MSEGGKLTQPAINSVKWTMPRIILVTVLPILFAAQVHLAAETSKPSGVENDWKADDLQPNAQRI
jgi:hypothetical protein